ncbi:hypothetical protein [Meiothermus sp.]|jgi:hypothetical protein|uniref:hypothetical protein n=1 Tax=Meiothermus sp. TaxID=1955249 RepID=UPI0021DC8D78|nr:hypothetical protein [Meiothermus sp.]GIW25281.1 MAG: hypothetical protein KatS3mg069_1548 [Meiothermus sp.]
MNKTVKTMLVISSLALAGAFAQQTPAPQPAPAQPMQRMMLRGYSVGHLYFAAAQFLGVTPAELAVLSGGTKTLAQVATDLGKTPAALEAALVTARNQAIDQAVQAGRLTAEQANTLKASSQAVAKAFVAQPVQMRFGPMGRDGRGPRGGWR